MYKITSNLRQIAKVIVFILVPFSLYAQGNDLENLAIMPNNSTVLVGEDIQFFLAAVDTPAIIPADSTVEWSLKGNSVGTISTTGLFSGSEPGQGIVEAKVGKDKWSTSVTLIDTAIVDSGINKISIIRVHPDSTDKKPRIAYEGEEHVLSGLKFPLNIYNGTRLFFPSGSISDDIVLKIQIPKFAKVANGDVEFSADIVNALKLDVYVADMLVSPFYFDLPITLAIPYKRGLLTKLGIEPTELGLYFAQDSTSFDTAGITGVVVDEASNRIFATVEHFSTLVTKKKGNPPNAKLRLKGGPIVTHVGDTVQFTADYTNAAGTKTDTVLIWTVSPDSLGAIDSTGTFLPTKVGQGRVFVAVDQLVDSANVTVLAAGEFSAENFLSITPSDTSIDVGDSLQYSASFLDTATNSWIDTTVAWSLHGTLVGNLSATGKFDALYQGKGTILAELGDYSSAASLTVVDTVADSSGINTILIYRIRPGAKNDPTPRRVYEGEDYTLGGLKKPLNVLNGTRIFFPLGSIATDIKIEIRVPKHSRVVADSVEYSPGVVGGFDASVLVNDSLVSPFFFNVPLDVAIPFKRGLLTKLGIDPSTLGMFFSVDSATLDTTGISGSIVDSTLNKIFSRVAHFSTVVVADKQTAILLSNEGRTNLLPQNYELQQNYPNPFNPTTSIRFNIPEMTDVSLIVYDLIGREIIRLEDTNLTAGYYKYVWEGTGSNGRKMPSGLYFARLLTKNYSKTIKMVLIK